MPSIQMRWFAAIAQAFPVGGVDCEDFYRFLAQAPVAQLDRAPDYESGGQEFESLRARQLSY
jgi:hypothetical protein